MRDFTFFLRNDICADDGSKVEQIYGWPKIIYTRDRATNIDGQMRENPRSSSTLFCRPVNFQFILESREVIQDAWQSVENEISLLTLTKIDTKTSVKHKILTTMFDGKICSTIAGFRSSILSVVQNQLK